MKGEIMSLYSEYLEAKSDLLSKDLAFKTAVEDWFHEHDLTFLQPIDVVESLTMDHITITTTVEFNDLLKDFEETFELKCVRINHQTVIVPDESIKHVWKFHFREKK